MAVNWKKNLVYLFLSSLIAIGMSLHLGVVNYFPSEIYHAFLANHDDNASLVIRNLRLPRALIAPLVGAALATAGLLLQSITKNPLASPGFLGVNAGASFAVVVAVSIFGVGSYWAIASIAASGAFMAALLVMGIALAFGGAFTPTHLLLAGVTLATFLTSMSTILLLNEEATMQSLLFWMSGGFADRDIAMLKIAFPIFGIAMITVFLLHRRLDAMLADDDSAQSLGVPVLQTRLIVIAIAAILSGLGVSLAGPIAFVGLVTPHIARNLVGLDHAKLIPVTVLLGAIITTFADVLARFISYPAEGPIGAVMALVGVPALIIILQSRHQFSSV